MLSFLLRPALAYMPALQPGAVGPATSVRMQVVAPAPAAKRASTGGGGYVGRGKRDAAVNDETMRWYLSSIGTRRLLDNTEEIRLAMAMNLLRQFCFHSTSPNHEPARCTRAPTGKCGCDSGVPRE